MKLDDASLSRSYLETISDEERRLLLEEISRFLSERILKASDFDREVEIIIGELRTLGHDLWLYDSDGEWQVWLGDYTKPENCGKLILDFKPNEGVEAMWNEPK